MLTALRREPLWYKDAVLYEVHVRAFYDSVGDGTGDFRGLAQKLDYLQDLGVTAIWLLPFYPSPLKDDGYDIADYVSINRDYGTLDAFQEFLDAAHARGLRVITELVINHTSDQHPWFQRARRAPPGSPERDFYVWSDTPDKYNLARIIFKDFESSNWSYDKVAQAYYWHRFYSHQPDLNFDNPAVIDALLPVMDFWFGMGVDGMRLDAIPYLHEREGTNCENLPETHTVLKRLRKHVDDHFPDRMLLAEANQWPEDSVAYFGDGDECHMAFHFPVMPRLFMSMHMEDRLPLVDILEQTPAIPANCQWAMFLRNHDELTLEMVTDEERDYMYQAYATDPQARINLGIRRRLAPLLGNNRRRIELMNGLLFSLPGTPVLYYGDEIGMGDNIYLGDRNGVRTPMQWSADRNAGFSRASPQKLYLPVIIEPEYHFEAVNVEAQQNNLNSLLWWTKRVIGMRRMHKAFSRGNLEFLRPLNRHVLAFTRSTDDETILVVANLSRFVQCVDLDLSAHAGKTPVELFGATHFPAVGTQPYLMMLGPHAFYWFLLSKTSTPREAQPAVVSDLPGVVLTLPWTQFAADPAVDQLESLLMPYLRDSGIRGRPLPNLRRVRVQDALPIDMGGVHGWLLVLDLEMAGSSVERTWTPVALVSEDVLTRAAVERRGQIARAEGADSGWIVDARSLPEFHQSLLRQIHDGRSVRGTGSALLVGVPTQNVWAGWNPADLPAVKSVSPHGSSTAAMLGEHYVLTEYSRVEVIPHPELEMGRWLTESRKYEFSPNFLGALEYRKGRNESMILASVQAYVPNEGTAWQITLDELSGFFDRTLTLPEQYRIAPTVPRSTEDPVPAEVLSTLSGYLDVVRLLAQRLADLHKVTSSEVVNAAFVPEPFGVQYQRSLYQSLRNLMQRTYRELRLAAADFPHEGQLLVHAVLDQERQVNQTFQKLTTRPIQSWRIRIHGDCHLGHFVRAGRNFILTDFDSRIQSVGERRIKRSALRDVAGMLHSFDYAATSALNGISNRRGQSVGMVRPEDYDRLKGWTEYWRFMVEGTFLSAYRQATADSARLTVSDEDFRLLLDAFLLERALEDAHRIASTKPAEGTPAVELVLRRLQARTGVAN